MKFEKMTLETTKYSLNKIICIESDVLFPERFKPFGSLFFCHVLKDVPKHFVSHASMCIQIPTNQVPNHRFGTVLRSDSCWILDHSHHRCRHSKRHHSHHIDLISVFLLQKLSVNVQHPFRRRV
jgi:hypothetical protein